MMEISIKENIHLTLPNCHIIGEMGKERELCVSGTGMQQGTEERVAVVLVQEECRVRPRLGRLREQKAIEGSGGMCPGSGNFCRLEYTGTGQSFGFFCKTHAAL